jgi:lipase ATG15
VHSASSIPALLLLFFSFVYILHLMKMHIRKKPHAICHSTGRVTAGLLLSFLALSNPSVASAAQKQQQPLPILNPVPSIPDNKPISSAGHVFVS